MIGAMDNGRLFFDRILRLGFLGPYELNGIGVEINVEIYGTKNRTLGTDFLRVGVYSS